MCDIEKNDEIYMASYYAFADDTVWKSPEIKKLYVSEITPCSGFGDSGYSIVTMKECIYIPNGINREYKMKIMTWKGDDLYLYTDKGREYHDGNKPHDNHWVHTFFTSYQAAVTEIVHHYECEISKHLSTLTNFKKKYGNADWDLLQMKTKEFSEDHKHYIKYEITDSIEKLSKSIEQQLEKSKYLIYKKEVELNYRGEVKNWGAPWLYDAMDPILICDSLEEASSWVAKNDKSLGESLKKVTQYRIKEVNPIKTIKEIKQK